MCFDKNNQQMIEDAERLLLTKNYTKILESSDTEPVDSIGGYGRSGELDDNPDKETAGKRGRKRKPKSDLDTEIRKSRRLRHENPDFEATEDLTSSGLKDTMKNKQKELMKNLLKKHKKKVDPVGVKHALNGNINALKNHYIRNNKNKIRKAIYGGFVTLPYKKHCGNKRSCVQDAFANLSNLFRFDLKDLIYEYFPPRDYMDTDIKEVMRHPLISHRFYIREINGHGKKGGLECFFYSKILPLGGKFMIKCLVHSAINKRKENHVFVVNADYKDQKYDVRAALIDNQMRNKLTGIQGSDLKDKESMRRICSKLYGGITYFNMIWRFELKKNMVEE